MTREDARYYLQSSGFSEEQINTIEQAFMQEPCDDCISRKAVLDINESHHGQMPNHINHQIWQEIRDLLPVKPQEPKTDILDNIRVEIDGLTYYWCEVNPRSVIDDVLKIIDKYKAERSD